MIRISILNQARHPSCENTPSVAAMEASMPSRSRAASLVQLSPFVRPASFASNAGDGVWEPCVRHCGRQEACAAEATAGGVPILQRGALRPSAEPNAVSDRAGQSPDVRTEPGDRQPPSNRHVLHGSVHSPILQAWCAQSTALIGSPELRSPPARRPRREVASPEARPGDANVCGQQSLQQSTPWPPATTSATDGPGVRSLRSRVPVASCKPSTPRLVLPADADAPILKAWLANRPLPHGQRVGWHSRGSCRSDHAESDLLSVSAGVCSHQLAEGHHRPGPCAGTNSSSFSTRSTGLASSEGSAGVDVTSAEISETHPPGAPSHVCGEVAGRPVARVLFADESVPSSHQAQAVLTDDQWLQVVLADEQWLQDLRKRDPAFASAVLRDRAISARIMSNGPSSRRSRFSF